MIEYSQIIDREDDLKDVLVKTDDANGEMEAFEDMIEECEFEIELPEDRNPSSGLFEFTIPGEMVGEFADCTEEFDHGMLSTLVEKWNEDMLDAAEKQE